MKGKPKKARRFGDLSHMTPEMWAEMEKDPFVIWSRSLFTNNNMKELEFGDIEQAYETHKREVLELLQLIGAESLKEAIQKLKSEKEKK